MSNEKFRYYQPIDITDEIKKDIEEIQKFRLDSRSKKEINSL
jgi:hypothetical protein